MHTVRVNLGPRSYDIAIRTGDPGGVGPFVRSALPKAALALVVADANTAPHGQAVGAALEAAGLRTAFATVPAGEESKSLAQLSRLYDALHEMAADRNTALVAVGGGVVGDLAGFAAATYNRGLPLVMVPTTLLAMVDSSVGGKTGINHPRGKNLIGAFHQPAGVWIDTAYLATLPEREFRGGLAEVVKYGVILDAEFFTYLEANADAVLARQPEALTHIVMRSCRLKADVVEKDEREETGLRAVLNYGHTFAHAFEVRSPPGWSAPAGSPNGWGASVPTSPTGSANCSPGSRFPPPRGPSGRSMNCSRSCGGTRNRSAANSGSSCRRGSVRYS
jgi:3-dehydroquinate synthase